MGVLLSNHLARIMFAQHIEVAAEAAREGVVLLKNGVPCRYATPLDDISSYGEVIYEMGCGEMACWNDSLIFPATEVAKKGGVTLLLMGLDLSIEAESLDRVDLLLPGYTRLN
ncbi:hypothetical protein OIU84_024753 [Salix udensis]|uniref:Uncharacterized protein n=1 Tax=Salix udensis TaxID=889485 RepID=A0AAD6KIH2_9ROSI|nr:hypothetical protein OIU84_024753 [Salix udensis]